MLDNIGLPGLLLIFVIIGLPIFLILRSGGNKFWLVVIAAVVALGAYDKFS